jgi:LuxR family transcriptional regulator, maltose regulon positive regulatory protein
MQIGTQDGTAKWILTAQRHAGGQWRSSVTTDEYAASVAVLDAAVGRGGVGEMIALCDDALRGLPADSPYRAAAAFLRGVGLTLQRDTERGLVSLQEAERLARILNVPTVQADSLSWQGVLALGRGERDLAIRHISEAAVLVQRNHLDRLATSAHIFAAQALVLAVGGDPAAGRASLGIARRMSGALDEAFPWFAVCGRLIVARAAVLLGDRSMARQLIAEARARMTPDLRETLARDLLDEAEAALRSSTTDGIASSPLTTAELRVLQFLPSNLTFSMIGEHLFLSTNTVKTHARSIYRKFGVDSRAAAVTRARAIGLVEAPVHDR